MSDIQSCVLTVEPITGTGTQALVNVVVDRAGNPFTPTFFIIQSGYAAADTLTFGPTYPTNMVTDFRGVDNGTLRSASCPATSNNVGGKIGGLAESLGDYSILDYECRAAFGGDLVRQAKIANISLGGFEIVYDQNDRTGDVLLITCFGGADLTVEPDATGALVNGTYTTSAKPQGLLYLNVPVMASSGATGTGTGQWASGWGWESRASAARGGAFFREVNQGTNYVGQRTDAICIDIDTSGALDARRPVVSAWGDLDYTISGSAATGIDGLVLAFCGASVITACGVLTQPTSTGLQNFTTGINAKWIMFVSTGRASTTAVNDPEYQMVRGWADGTTQSCVWIGDSTPGNAGPFTGARYLSTVNILNFGTPDAGSTFFTSSARLTDLSSIGAAQLTWDSVDGVEREILWFAMGEAVSPPTPVPPAVATATFMRKLRRSPTISQEQMWNFFTRFQLDFQAGGPRDGVDPIEICLRYSDDSGNTWSNEMWLTVDVRGGYDLVAQWWQLGRARDRVWEIYSDSPALTVWLAAYMDVIPGTHG